VKVVENGVDVDYFRPSPGAERPGSLVFVGGMNWYPNRDAVIHFLTDIWPIVLRSNPRRSVTIIGQHPPAEVTRLDDGRVHVTGFVDDIRPHLDAAEIYICPMRDGGGTRLKILDALAMEKALVASGLAVEGIDLIEDEHYVRADTPTDFARAIDRLGSDPSLRRRLGRNGRLLVERKYAWSVIGQSLEAAYADAIASGEGEVLS
jgi:glycosyltransferase involved in cell wall biosynthesis